MKTNNQNSSRINTASHKNARPDVRDNLDSRSNEEQDFKGNDETHNEKETKKDKLKKKH